MALARSCCCFFAIATAFNLALSTMAGQINYLIGVWGNAHAQYRWGRWCCYEWILGDQVKLVVQGVYDEVCNKAYHEAVTVFSVTRLGSGAEYNNDFPENIEWVTTWDVDLGWNAIVEVYDCHGHLNIKGGPNSQVWIRKRSGNCMLTIDRREPATVGPQVHVTARDGDVITWDSARPNAPLIQELPSLQWYNYERSYHGSSTILSTSRLVIDVGQNSNVTVNEPPCDLAADQVQPACTVVEVRVGANAQTSHITAISYPRTTSGNYDPHRNLTTTPWLIVTKQLQQQMGDIINTDASLTVQQRNNMPMRLRKSSIVTSPRRRIDVHAYLKNIFLNAADGIRFDEVMEFSEEHMFNHVPITLHARGSRQRAYSFDIKLSHNQRLQNMNIDLSRSTPVHLLSNFCPQPPQRMECIAFINVRRHAATASRLPILGRHAAAPTELQHLDGGSLRLNLVDEGPPQDVLMSLGDVLALEWISFSVTLHDNIARVMRQTAMCNSSFTVDVNGHVGRRGFIESISKQQPFVHSRPGYEIAAVCRDRGHVAGPTPLLYWNATLAGDTGTFTTPPDSGDVDDADEWHIGAGGPTEAAITDSKSVYVIEAPALNNTAEVVAVTIRNNSMSVAFAAIETLFDAASNPATCSGVVIHSDFCAQPSQEPASTTSAVKTTLGPTKIDKAARVSNKMSAASAGGVAAAMVFVCGIAFLVYRRHKTDTSSLMQGPKAVLSDDSVAMTRVCLDNAINPLCPSDDVVHARDSGMM